MSKAADISSRESREKYYCISDIQSREEIVYNLKKGSFSAVA